MHAKFTIHDIRLLLMLDIVYAKEFILNTWYQNG